MPLAHAEPAPPYQELLKLALRQAPALLEQAAAIRAAAGDARQARALPNPSISVEWENLGGTSVNSSPSTPQSTFSITQPLELAQHEPHIAAGEAALRAEQARGVLTKVDYAAKLALAYATAEALQQRLQGAQDNMDNARHDVKAAQALVQMGKEAPLRVAQAQASLSSAMAQSETIKADLAGALAELSALVGAQEPYTSVPPVLLVDSIRPAMGPETGTSPAIIAAQAERDAIAAQVRVERSKRIPDIGITGGFRRYGGSQQTGFVLGLTTSIPIFDQNRGAIAAAQARRDAADQRLAAARLATDAARLSALAQVAASATRLQAATQSEEAAAEGYRLARIGYEAGKTALLEVLTLRRAVIDAKTLTIDARLARISALATLARIDGQLAFGDL